MLANFKRILCIALICVFMTGCLSSAPQVHETSTSTLPSYSNQPQTVITTTDTTPTTSAPETSVTSTEPLILLPPSSGFVPQLSVSQTPQKPKVDIPSLSAKQYFIYDTRTQEFLYINCDASKTIYPASTTKLFTTYVALQYLTPNQIITVGNELSYMGSDASTAGFRRGDRVSVEGLAYGALLPSGCDASYILAAAAGKVILKDQNATAKSAIQAFMNECNRMAKELGMGNTNLVTPDGYHHKDHRISMEAFAIIGSLCLNHKLISRIVASTKATITYIGSNGKSCTLQFQNTNKCILPSSSYYNKECIGLKTGYTTPAGYCLLTAYKVDGRYVIIGIFGCASANTRFKDANKLFEVYRPYL